MIEQRIFLTLRAFARGLCRLLTAIAMALFAAVILALGTEIVMRFGFDRPLAHVHEAVTIAVVIMVMFGAAAAYATQEEVVIDVLAERLPLRAGLWLALGVHLSIALASGVIAWETLTLIPRQARASTPSLNLPLSVYGWPLFIAAVCFVVFGLLEAWGCRLALRYGANWSLWPPPDRFAEPLDDI